MLDTPCSFYISNAAYEDDADSLVAPSVQDIQKQLENSHDAVKLKGMRELLLWTHNAPADQAQAYQRLFITVIRFVAPSRNHQVRKLVQLYWETVPQVDEAGNMRQEMILVSNFIRNDLQHANEYVRGNSLRSLAKMCTVQLLSTVSDCFQENLQHQYTYVRRNAAMCIAAIVQRLGPVLPQTVPDLEKMAVTEENVATQRAAILALAECDPISATQLFLLDDRNRAHLGEMCHLAVIHLVKIAFKLICQTFPPTQVSIALSQKVTKEILVERLLDFLDESTSDAVTLEAAITLLWVGGYTHTISKAACKALVKVLLSQKDINVRMGVIDKLITVSRKCMGVLDEHVIDVLRVLSSPSAELCQKVLVCTLPVIRRNNVTAAVNVIKGELVKSMDVAGETAKRGETQKQLVRAMRYLSGKFPDVAESVIDLLLDSLTDADKEAVARVALLVRELVVTNEQLRPRIMESLVEGMPEMSSGRALRLTIWILGELCADQKMRSETINTLYQMLGPYPWKSRPADAALSEGEEDDEEEEAAPAPVEVTVRTVILPDGAYGTENVIEAGGSTGANVSSGSARTGLRHYICDTTDTLSAAVVGAALTKLCARQMKDQRISAAEYNKVLLMLASMTRFFKDDPFFGPSSDVVLRLSQCMRIVMKGWESGLCTKSLDSLPHDLVKVIEMERESTVQEGLNLTNDGTLIDSSLEHALGPDEDLAELMQSNVYDVLSFRTLNGSEESISAETTAQGFGDEMATLDYSSSIELAVKGSKGVGDAAKLMLSLSRQNKAERLTGSSDPIYVEAVLQNNHLDMIMEILLVNQTEETLQNVQIYLCVHGDIRIIDRPQTVTLDAWEETTVFATLRLSSTEVSRVFGYIGFERGRNAATKEYITLSVLPIDLVSCIQRAYIGAGTFRSLWPGLEWENKFVLELDNDDMMGFLAKLLKTTKMTVVGLYGDTSTARQLAQMKGQKAMDILEDAEAAATERYLKAVEEDKNLQQMAKSKVFAVNLCARTCFGEDALMNLSLETNESGKVSGCVRIRSRKQGICVNLGNLVAASQCTQAVMA